MLILHRTIRRHYNAFARRLRRTRSGVSAAHVLLAAEAATACVALLLALTGTRAVILERLDPRADAGAALLAAALLAGLHFWGNQRVLAALGRRPPSHTYDERRILLDLGRTAQEATNINQVYEAVVGAIADALGACNVAIFVRDETSGDYVCRVSSDETGRHARRVLAGESLVVKRVRGLGTPLRLTARDLETWLRAAAALDSASRVRRADECATLRLVDARLLLGITIRERLVGILSVGSPRAGRDYSVADKRMLMAVTNQLAFVVENAKLAERMVAEEGLRRELALAREVQQRLLPTHAPRSTSLDLAAFCQPARGVGGDYYDFLELGDGRTGVAIADVAGKGISAALLMSSVQASLRSQAMNREMMESTPAELVCTMNRLVHRSTGAASYVTFFYAEFDAQARTLTYVNAGHNPPLLLKAAAQISGHPASSLSIKETMHRRRHTPMMCATSAARQSEECGVAVLDEEDERVVIADALGLQRERRELTAGGSVLGVFEDCAYEQETLCADSGDLIVLYTDGLTEALDVNGAEFGEEQLRSMLAALALCSADEVRDAIVRQVREWSAGAAQHDDLTLVVMKVK